jgi:phage tail-like protein
MLINSSAMIPQVYSKERDIQVFNKLIDIILTCCKYDIDNIGNVYDAYKCPVSLLPLLAYTLNYKYNFSDTVTANRRIIDAFSTMEKYRGSEIGLKIAAALSLTSLDISRDNAELETDDDYMNALRDMKINYDYENARIVIDYPNIYHLVRYIMDYVRPVGMWLELRAVVGKSINTDAMLIYADAEAYSNQYVPEIDSHVSRSFVNLSGIADLEWINENFTDDNNYTLDLSN